MNKVELEEIAREAVLDLYGADLINAHELEQAAPEQYRAEREKLFAKVTAKLLPYLSRVTENAEKEKAELRTLVDEVEESLNHRGAFTPAFEKLKAALDVSAGNQQTEDLSCIQHDVINCSECFGGFNPEQDGVSAGNVSTHKALPVEAKEGEEV